MNGSFGVGFLRSLERETERNSNILIDRSCTICTYIPVYIQVSKKLLDSSRDLNDASFAIFVGKPIACADARPGAAVASHAIDHHVAEPPFGSPALRHDLSHATSLTGLPLALRCGLSLLLGADQVAMHCHFFARGLARGALGGDEVRVRDARRSREE